LFLSAPFGGHFVVSPVPVGGLYNPVSSISLHSVHAPLHLPPLSQRIKSTAQRMLSLSHQPPHPIIVDLDSDGESEVDTPAATTTTLPFRYQQHSHNFNYLPPHPLKHVDSSMSFNTASSCATPYPQSSDSESDSEPDGDEGEDLEDNESHDYVSSAVRHGLDGAAELAQAEALITTASGAQLREVMFRLLRTGDAMLSRAVTSELRSVGFQTARDVISKTPKRERRRPRTASAPQPPFARDHPRRRRISLQDEHSSNLTESSGGIVYHPGAFIPLVFFVLSAGSLEIHLSGNLLRDVYEFVSTAEDGSPAKALQTITMWSCCDQDALMPGCRRSTRLMMGMSDSETESSWGGS
jgi:hypothetical protein